MMVRRVARTAPCGLVQVIRLDWDKSARGGQGARDRNAVPSAFVIPADHLLDAGGQLHVEEFDWGSRNSFSEPLHCRQNRLPLEHGYAIRFVSVSSHEQGLLVRFQWDGRGGAPRRWFLSQAESLRQGLVVHAGQWVQVCWNGRFTDCDTGGWWYEQVTVNVAWFTGEPSGRIFVEREASRSIQLLSDIW